MPGGPLDPPRWSRVVSRLRHPLLDETRRPDALSRLAYYGLSILRLLHGLDEPRRTVGVFLGLRRPAARPVHVRCRNLRFHVRSPEDIWSVKETLLDRFYERPGVEPADEWTVMDVGGGIGDFAVDVAARRPSARVHVFEPDPSARRLVALNVAANDLGNVRIHGEALAARTGSARLSEASSDPLRRLAGEDGDGAPVAALGLADALDRAEIEVCDLLKLDCEGAEHDIVRGAGNALERVRLMVGEFHELGERRNLDDLVAALEAHGFAVSCTRNYVQPHTGYFWARRVAPLA